MSLAYVLLNQSVSVLFTCYLLFFERVSLLFYRRTLLKPYIYWRLIITNMKIARVNNMINNDNQARFLLVALGIEGSLSHAMHWRQLSLLVTFSTLLNVT